MKILVTGATGMLGSHLTKTLTKQGHTVHILVRSKEKAEKLNFPNLNIFEGDVTNKPSIDAAMDGCHQVYHLAAYVGVWAPDDGIFYKVNVEGTANVLQSAVEHNIQKVVITSTAGILGPSIHGVVTEEKVRDTDILNEYEGSKIMAELRAKDYIIRYNLNVVFVLPTRVIGPVLIGEPDTFILVIDRYLHNGWRLYPGTGHEIGNYVYIDDVIKGHLLAMEKGNKGESYILGGENISYRTFFKIISEISGIRRRMFYVPYWLQMLGAKIALSFAVLFNGHPLVTPKWITKGRYNYELSTEKAIKELGYSFISIREGIRMTIEKLK